MMLVLILLTIKKGIIGDDRDNNEKVGKSYLNTGNKNLRLSDTRTIRPVSGKYIFRKD